MRKIKILNIFLLFIFQYIYVFGVTTFKVARIFSDNMVLQQGIYVPIWGWAKPGSTVKVEIGDDEYCSSVDEQGKWIIKVSPRKAGGPYELVITNEREQKKFINVMFGEVWLACGQSNMNFRLSSVIDSKVEIQNANYPEIREFSTPNVVSRVPLDDLTDGCWNVCTSENAREFSAVAYYFARSLHLDKKVPVGIIHSSWSGTICESWISSEMLFTLPEFKNKVLEEIYNSDEDWGALQKKEDEKNEKRKRIVRTTKVGLIENVHNLDYNDRLWKSSRYPIYASRVGLGGYKLIWFRREFCLSGKEADKDLILHLGKIIRSDITYVNGVEVGRTEWEGERTYNIPSNILREGKNVISIRLLSEWGYGRLGDEASKPHIFSEDGSVDISLSGIWKYNGNIEPKLPVGKGFSNNISCMYNTKIAPIVPYGIRGFIWYQGEGNSGNPELYKKLQPTLINDWRIRFQQGYLPFLFVQLPNINGGNWQLFREAQSKSLDLPNVGMAVTIDVGDPYDIHPRNKKIVGERLYLRAKEIVYKDVNGVYQGPVYKSCSIEGNKLVISFSSVGSGLISNDGKTLRTFEIAGKDGKYVSANAIIENDDSIIVWNDSVASPIYVRHGWSSNPDINLYNKEGFPCSSFRICEK